jgi:plasmid maintenance system antidote protein VapI
MTTKFAHLGHKIKHEMQRLELRPKDIADHFGIKQPSVNDLFETGRLAKKHYAKLVELNGMPLEWWFDLDAEYRTTDDEDAFFGEASTPAPLVARERAAMYKATHDLEASEKELLDLFRALPASEQEKVTNDLRSKAGYFRTLLSELMSKVTPKL